MDEEQRFGVGHKETLKEMSKNVDVLTLSATPIPRTLNMALSGIRDMSSIEAPQNRHPVQTFVLEQNDGVLLDAIRRELGRAADRYTTCTTAWSPSSDVRTCGSSGFRMRESASFTAKWVRKRSLKVDE